MVTRIELFIVYGLSSTVLHCTLMKLGYFQK